MKKFNRLLIIFVFLLFQICTIRVYADVLADVVDCTVTVNGQKQILNNKTISINDRIYLPIRELGGILNLYISWDDNSKTINISDIGIKNSNEIGKQLDLKESKVSIKQVDFRVKINGYVRTLKNKIAVIDGVSYLPIREISEYFGIDINWDDESKIVMIEYKNDINNENTLLPFELNGLYGYMDTNGNIVIEPQYRDALPFSEGMAAVAGENGLYGYINTSGDIVIPYEYGQVDSYEKTVSNFSEGVAVVNGNMYIDKLGNKILGEYKYADDFHDGFAVVETIYGKFAYIDKEGKIKKEYDTEPSPFNYGYAITENNVIDTNFDCICSLDNYDTVDLNEGYITVSKNGMYGVIDTYGNVIIDFDYKYLSKFSGGLFAFRNDGNMGYIDLNNNVIIPEKYSYADIFIDNIALVMTSSGSEYVIDKSGNILSKLDSIKFYIEYPKGIIKIFSDDNEWFYLDRNGLAIRPNYIVDKK